MNTATVVAEAETPPVDEAQAQIDFDSGMQNTQPTATPAVVDAPAEVVAPKYVQITEEDFNTFKTNATHISEMRATMEKQFGTAFGKFGQLERTLTELASATPAGQSIEVTDDIVDEINEDFPELGSKVLSAFKKFAQTQKGTGSASVAPEVIAQMVDARTDAIQLEDLTNQYPDWRELTGAPDSNSEYRQWLAKQPEAYQATLNSTRSAGIIARSIAAFKSTAAPAPKASARAATIRDAVTPTGSGGQHAPGLTPEQELEAGYATG